MSALYYIFCKFCTCKTQVLCYKGSSKFTLLKETTYSNTFGWQRPHPVLKRPDFEVCNYCEGDIKISIYFFSEHPYAHLAVADKDTKRKMTLKH